jgi:hypothetical protein
MFGTDLIGLFTREQRPPAGIAGEEQVELGLANLR